MSDREEQSVYLELAKLHMDHLRQTRDHGLKVNLDHEPLRYEGSVGARCRRSFCRGKHKWNKMRLSYLH